MADIASNQKSNLKLDWRSLMASPSDKLRAKYVKALWKERDRIVDMIAAVTRPNGVVRRLQKPTKKLKRVK